MFDNLSNLSSLEDFETRSISAENPNGEKGGGAKAESNGKDSARELGRGWKVLPCRTLPPQSVTTVAEIAGPGVISHIWITADEAALADSVLRFRWDGEATPSVEVPLGDFFCNGHGLRCNVVSLPVAVNPTGAMNCYWPMPFRKSCEITVENQRPVEQGCFFYQIDYQLRDVLADAAYFHAQYRRSITTRACPEHTILDGVQGDGQYVGTYLAWTQMSDGWWGEGEVKFFLDGDEEFPTYCGTGTEDYFCGAWGFGETFSAPFSGYPLWHKVPGDVPKHGLYRWHVPDPIRFRLDFKATVQALGWWPDGIYEPLTDDIASVGYWYQREPHAGFPVLPSRRGRHPRRTPL
jgi:hypothetical protein